MRYLSVIAIILTIGVGINPGIVYADLHDELIVCEPHETPDFCVPVQRRRLIDELTMTFAVDGSKQPQDFGVNASTGFQASMNWGLPIYEPWGLGFQFGSSFIATNNAVRVYELLGETTNRTQVFTTIGFFQRLGRLSWGFGHDFLNEDYYDDFSLGQWRTRISFDLGEKDQIGLTGMLKSYGDDGVFGAGTNVHLNSIDQLQVYWRHFWETGAQTTFWCGVAEGHGEDNAVTGFAPGKDDPILFGADVLMPLNSSFAIYGECNMIMPVDTGTVDAFLGIQWYPGRNAFWARRGQFSPLLPTAAPTTFSVDLQRR